MLLGLFSTPQLESVRYIYSRFQFSLSLPDQLAIPTKVGLGPSLTASTEKVDYPCHKLTTSTALQLGGSVLP